MKNKLLTDLYKLGGAVKSSDWTNGSGRYITRRSIPDHCDLLEHMYFTDQGEFLAYNQHREKVTLKGEIKKKVLKILKVSPRVQKIVAITDLRKAKKLIKENI